MSFGKTLSARRERFLFEPCRVRGRTLLSRQPRKSILAVFPPLHWSTGFASALAS